MSSIPSTSTKHSVFRGGLLVFAFVLACQAAWILAAEISRPLSFRFPFDAQAAAAAAANRDEAGLAASFGLIRGDLWAEDALTYLATIWSVDTGNASGEASRTIDRARDVAERALALAPHDARIWLVLASIDTRFDWLKRNRAAALRMSYYTGANEIALVPSRLRLAVRSDAITDQDFQQLVRHDIRIIATRKPELNPAILAAYRGASPSGQQFLEQTLAEVDPGLRARLRSR